VYARTPAIPHILALSVSMLFFLGCTGLYLSSRIGRTTTAVTAHLILVGGIWLILPIGAFAVADVLNHMELIHADPLGVAEDAFRFVPFAQGFLLTHLVHPLVSGDVSDFHWAGFRGAWGFLFMVMIVAGSYILVALPFVARAVKAFRRAHLDAHP